MSETAVEQYVMPKPSIGQAVIYYPRGIVSKGNIVVGYVNGVSNSNIEVLVSGRLHDGVCHVSDPSVDENKFVREFGLWDFSDRDKDIDRRLAAIEAKVGSTFKSNKN